MSKYTVKDVGILRATSSASTVTNGLGHFDDAESLTIFVTSSAAGVLIGSILQISQFDPADYSALTSNLVQPTGVTQSSGWFVYSTGVADVVTSSGVTITIKTPSFRGIRIGTMTSSTLVADAIAYVSKKILV